MKDSSKTYLVAGLTAAIVCIGILWAYNVAYPPTRSEAPAQSSQYSQIRSSGVIHAAYAVGAPLFTINPNTNKKGGIFYEIVERAAEKLNLEVKWTEEVGYGSMIKGLETGRYDIVGSGVWINGARGARADFTKPAYYDAIFPYVRQGDTRFHEDLSILNSSKYSISVMDGELGQAIAEKEFPKAKTVELPQSADFTQLIRNVVNRKADVVFLSLAAAKEYQAANPTHIEAVNIKDPIRVFPISIMLPKGSYELKKSLDYALTEMLTNGEIEAILRDYEEVRGSFVRSARPYQIINPEK